MFSLGDYEVIPKDFAQKIKGMAGYRNRLVHLYWKVTPEEILTTIKNNLDDFDEFISHIRNFLKQTCRQAGGSQGRAAGRTR